MAIKEMNHISFEYVCHILKLKFKLEFYVFSIFQRTQETYLVELLNFSDFLSRRNACVTQTFISHFCIIKTILLC